MKRLLIFLFVLTKLVSYGQSKIGMSPVFSFMPSAAGNSTVGVQFGDTVRLTVYIKNSGNAAFTGGVKVTAKRDTTGGVLCDSSGVFFSVPFLPNDSVAITLAFNPTSGIYEFKSGGNGNTIVVWPYIVSGTTMLGDSVRPVVWINNVNSVFEFEKNQFKIYPNPVLHDITIKPLKEGRYTSIIIYDMFARKVKETSFKETTDVSDLTPGSYWMIIRSEEKSYRINFIKE
ncbi:MAG: T9SS type A sorting domain-containing protein [Bacteroidota bacterium]